MPWQVAVVEYSTPFVTGKLIKRYKRFLADIVLDNGEKITAHVPNTGSMLSTKDPGSTVAVSYNPSPKRKLQWTLELVKSNDTWVGVNTYATNRMVEFALTHKQIPQLNGYAAIRREVKYGTNSRVDFLLTNPLDKCYVEVKNVTYKHGAGALFPDAVTARGTKHLQELTAMKQNGHRAVIFFLVNRNDCLYMSPASKIDPVYSKALTLAVSHGVEAMAYRFIHTVNGYRAGEEIPVILGNGR